MTVTSWRRSPTGCWSSLPTASIATAAAIPNMSRAPDTKRRACGAELQSVGLNADGRPGTLPVESREECKDEADQDRGHHHRRGDRARRAVAAAAGLFPGLRRCRLQAESQDDGAGGVRHRDRVDGDYLSDLRRP